MKLFQDIKCAATPPVFEVFDVQSIAAFVFLNIEDSIEGPKSDALAQSAARLTTEICHAQNTVVQSSKSQPDTYKASHSHANGQLFRCFAIKADLMSLLIAKAATFLGCRVPP